MNARELFTLLFSKPSSLLDDLGLRNDFETAFQKLLAAAPAPIQQNAGSVLERIHVDGAGWHESKETYRHLSTVQEAVWKEKKLKIQYLREREAVERIVNPLGLVAKRNVWYLVCQVNAEIRTYRISRMTDAVILEEEPFVRPANFNLTHYWEQSMVQFKSRLPRYPAKLSVRENLLPRLSQERYVRVLAAYQPVNGWNELEVEFETLDSACEIVLSCGASVKVLEPLELRTKVMVEAEAVAGLYAEG